MIRCICGHQLAAVVSDTEGDTARVIVYRCDQCLHHVALQLNLRDLGIPGCGTKRDDRTHRNDPTSDPRCGTDNGFRAHSQRNEKACDPCRQAHTAATNEYRQRRKAAAAA